MCEVFEENTLGCVDFDIPDIRYSRQFTSIPCLGACGALNGGWQWLPCFQIDACTQQILAKPPSLLKRRSKDFSSSRKTVEHTLAETDQPWKRQKLYILKGAANHKCACISTTYLLNSEKSKAAYLFCLFLSI